MHICLHGFVFLCMLVCLYASMYVPGVVRNICTRIISLLYALREGGSLGGQQQLVLEAREMSK